MTTSLARFAAQTWETLPKPFRLATPMVRSGETKSPAPAKPANARRRHRQLRPARGRRGDHAACEGLGAAGWTWPSLDPRLQTVLFDGLFDAGGVTEAGQRLTALRAIDKFDRLGWDWRGPALPGQVGWTTGRLHQGRPAADEGDGAIEAFLASATVRPTRAETLEAVPVPRPGRRDRRRWSNWPPSIAKVPTRVVGPVKVKFDPTIVRGTGILHAAVRGQELLLDTTDDKGRPVRRAPSAAAAAMTTWSPGSRVRAFRRPASRSASRVCLGPARGGTGRRRTRAARWSSSSSEDDMGHYLNAVAELRAAGVAAELYLGRAGMKAQAKYADRRAPRPSSWAATRSRRAR